MKKINKGFTLVEIIVVITILVILSTLGIVNYASNLSDSRNTKRISDLSSLSVALKESKMDKGVYPYPDNSFVISNGSGNDVAYQGVINDNVPLKNVLRFPNDPYLKSKNYVYSITKDRGTFQLATVLEYKTVTYNDIGLKSYLIGDFKTSNITVLPTIIVADTADIDISTTQNEFIADKLELNLPYDLTDGTPYVGATTLTDILTSSAEIQKFYGYYDCQEIVDNGVFYGTGYYQILSDDTISASVECIQCNGATDGSTATFDGSSCS